MLQAITVSPLVKNVYRKERGRNTNLVFSWNFIQSLFNCEPLVWSLMHYKHICLHIFSVGFQKHGYYCKIKAVTGIGCPEHGRRESDLLLVFCADLRADFFWKVGQVWKWLFPLFEASPNHNGADGAVRCILYTDITNRQKAPYVQDNRNAVNILVVCTLEQICCWLMRAAFPFLSSLAPWLCHAGGSPPPREARSPTSCLGCSQAEVAANLTAKRLVHVGGKNPGEEHAWYIKHYPLPVLNNNLIILSCVRKRRMLLILFNPLWFLN